MVILDIHTDVRCNVAERFNYSFTVHFDMWRVESA
jgi:hypothetical protein